MKHLIPILIFLNISCAFTAPSGSKELEKAILEDKKNQAHLVDNPLIGDPQFIKVRAYPQIREGHIVGAHWILMQVGRKNLDFEEILKKTYESSAK